MGTKKDDVIEGGNVSKDIPILKPPVKVWTAEFLPLIDETPTEAVSSGQADAGGVAEAVGVEQVPKGPTPAALMLQTVSNPRPSELSVPVGANGEETSGIDTLYSQLVSDLTTQEGEDLSTAKDMVLQIKEAVGNVPLRIAREIEERRETLRSALALLKVPDGLAETERLPLAETEASLGKSIGVATTLDALEKLSPAVTSHGDKLRLAAEIVVRRGERAESLSLRLARISPAEGLPEDEKTSFGLDVTGAGQDLKPPYSPEVLDNAEKLAGELEAAALQQGVAVSDRAMRAETLKLRLNNIQPPLRVTQQEADTLARDVGKAVLMLAPPHAVLTLDAVDKTAGELEGQVKTLAEAVVKRGQRDKDVRSRVMLLTDPPGLNDAEKDDLKKANDAATTLLTDPPTDKTLGEAEAKAGEAEGLHAGIGKAIAERVDKRKELTDQLDKIDIPATARPTDFRLRAKAGAEIRKTIAGANAADTLVKAEEAVVAELKTVADLVTFIQERVLAEKELAAARITLTAAEKTADQGYVMKLRNTIFDAAKSAPGLSTLPEVAMLRKTLADVLLLEVQSEAYANEFRAFLTGSAACEMAATLVDKPAVTAAIKKVRLAAQANALNCDYVGARQQLATFDTEAALPNGALAVSTLWTTAAKAFTISHGQKLQLIKSCNVPGGARLHGLVDTARALPLVRADVPNAIVVLNGYEPQIDELYNVAVLWIRYKSMKTNVTPLVGVNLALSNATGHLNGQNYGAAKADLDTLAGTDFEKKGKDKERLAELKLERDLLLPRLDVAQKTLLTDKYTLANTAVTSNTVTSIAKNLEMDGLLDLLTALKAWVPVNNEVKVMKAKFAKTYNLLDAADAEVLANDYAKAETYLQTAKTKLVALREAEDLMRRAEALRDTQVANTPPHQGFVKAITDANAALTNDKDPDKALVLLRPVVNDPLLKVVAAEIAVWQTRYPVAEKATRRAGDMMDLSAPKKVLTDSLAAAVAEATLNKYRDALDLLDLHEPVLKLAATYAAVRKRALGMFLALLDAENEFPTKTAEIFGTKGKVALVKMRDDAEVLAATTDFAAATKAFNDLVDECKVQAFETGKLFEAKDADNTNAGHALESHGAHTKEADHLTRLQTGVAPDGKERETKTTTQFTDPAIFLAARQAAKAKAPIFPPAPPLNFATISFPRNVDEKLLKKTVVIDHCEAIGKGLIGVKQADELLPDGSVAKAKQKFETWQNLDGFSKTKTVFTFEFDSPDPLINLKSPRNVDDYTRRYAQQVERDRASGAQPSNASLVPTILPGRWVTMQIFPEAAGWDQEKGEYVE